MDQSKIDHKGRIILNNNDKDIWASDLTKDILKGIISGDKNDRSHRWIFAKWKKIYKLSEKK